MILIIDNKSKFLNIFIKKLRKAHIKFMIIRAGQRMDIGKIKGVKGVILSGGSLGLYGKSISNNFIALMNFKVPIIGLCMGHEVIASFYGGTFEKIGKNQNKIQEVIIDSRDPIFNNLGKKVYLREKHVNFVSRLPKNFKILAHSKTCKIEVMKHKKKKIYGFQSHPENSGKDGLRIMNNFLEMCGIKGKIS